MGSAAALNVSRALHVLAIGALVAVGVAVQGGLYYFSGVAVSGALLVFEQYLASKGRTQAAFFGVNMALSAIFFVFVLLERVMSFRPVA
jgi:4-hydroxybenzoate polyprenyltransferase